MEWRETKTTGGFLTNKPIVFTKDSKYMFSCCGSVVKMFSVTTGEQMRFLKGHTDKVIGVAINPMNQFQLFSFSLDGTVKVWDYNDAVLVRSFNFSFPIIDFAFDPTQSNKLYLVTTLKKFVRYDERKANYTKQKNAYFSAMRKATAKGLPLPQYEDYFTGKIEKVKSDEFVERTVFRVYCWNYLKDPPVGLKPVCRPKSCKGFMVTPDSRHFVIRTGKSITIWDTKTQSFFNFKNSSRITSIALHPKQDFVVTGDELGQIKLWYCFVKDPSDETTKMVKSDPKAVVLHWHSQYVTALSFDAEGHYLFSGGKEMVFVIWQLATQKKDFIPRIGSQLVGIHTTPDHSIYAVSCADNAIKLISTRSRNLLVSIEGIKYGGEYLRTGLIREPKSNQLVFNGSGGHLQFFEVFEDRHVAHMEILPPNPIRNFGSKTIMDPYVSNLCFSTSGQWMVTVDFRPETKEQTLKFWVHDAKRQQYYLNSQVNNPHEQKVSYLAYSPANDMCVTTSWDGKFKIWATRDRTEVPAVNEGKGPRHTKEWYCRSVGFYRNNRDGSRMPTRACSFSHDGSLLAIAFENIITLWNPQTTTLLNTLVYPATFEYIKEVHFLPSSSYLVAVSTERILVWELLSMSLWWSYVIDTDLFAVHPTKPKFVAVSKGFVDEDSEKGYDKHDQNRLFLFEGASPKPLSVLTINTPMKGIGFVPNKADRASSTKSKLMADPCSIIYLTGNQEFKFVRELSREDYEARLRNIQTEADNYQLTLNKKPLAEGDTIYKQLYGDEEIDDYLRRKAMFQTPEPSSVVAPVAAASAPKDASDYSDLMMVGDEDAMVIDQAPAAKPAVGLPVVFSAAAHSKLSNFFDGPSHTIPTPSIVYNKFVERLLPKKEDSAMNGVEETHLDKSGEDYDNQNYNRELDVDLALDFEQSMNKLLSRINEPKLLDQEINVSSTAKFTLPQYDFLGGDFFENPAFKQAPAIPATPVDTPAKSRSQKKKESATPAKKSTKSAEKEEENIDNSSKKNNKHEYDSLAMDQDDETTSTPKAKSRRKSVDGADTPAKSNTNTPKSSTPKSKAATPVPDSGKRGSKRKQSEMSPNGK